MESSCKESDNSTKSDVVQGNSNEDFGPFCDPCHNDGKNLPVEGYCVDCEENLCVDCYRVHCRPSVTRHHILQEKKNTERKKPSKPEMCHVHPEQSIDYFCELHEEIFCAACKSLGHGNCKNVKPIRDILEEIDITKTFSEFKYKIKDLVSDIRDTQNQVQASLKAIIINHSKARLEMDTLRKEVKNHIDEIEKNLDKELKKIRDEDFAKISAYKNTCNAMHFDISTVELYLQSKMSTTNKYELFMAMKKAESKIKSNQHDLQTIRTNNKVRRYEFNPEQEVSALKIRPYSFGKFSMKGNVMKTAQFVEDINVKTEKDTTECYISGITLMSETVLAMVDNKNKVLKIINTEEKRIVCESTLSSPPWDITTLPEDKIALTLPTKATVKIVSISMPDADKIADEKSILVDGQCRGIDHIPEERQLLVSYCNPGKVEILGLDGLVVRKVDIPFNNPIYVSVVPKSNTKACISDTGHIGIGNYGHGKVLYIDIGKKPKQLDVKEYFNRYYITPLALAPDHCGNMYISDYGRKLYVYSPTGAICNEGLQKFDSAISEVIDFQKILTTTQGIAFCNKSYKLYVGVSDGNIEVYTVA